MGKVKSGYAMRRGPERAVAIPMSRALGSLAATRGTSTSCLNISVLGCLKGERISKDMLTSCDSLNNQACNRLRQTCGIDVVKIAGVLGDEYRWRIKLKAAGGHHRVG